MELIFPLLFGLGVYMVLDGLRKWIALKRRLKDGLVYPPDR